MDARQNILVVEDEEHLAVGIKFNLEAEGYAVRVVPDGAAALEVINEDKSSIDLIVLDLMLPGMSGYAVCESLRKSGHSMPILILSARTLPEDRARGFDVGADQYLNKPFELDELLSRAKNLLARYRHGPTPNETKETTYAYSFGDAHVDFDTHEVRVDGKEVHMTPLELRLLEYFIHNEGRVIPRGELLEKVWGMPAHLKTRAPDQFIRRLRKTFEPKPNEPQHFLTVRDAGYRFVAKP